jgi:hypothetical protein
MVLILPGYESSVWPFLTVTAAIVSAVLGAVVAYGLTLWQNRLLPWITILSFSTTTKSNDIVAVDAPLVEASQRSRTYITLSPESQLSLITSAHRASKNFLAANPNSSAVLDSALVQLRAATTYAEVIPPLNSVLYHVGLNRFLATAIWRNELPIPDDDPALPVYLYHDLRSDIENGTFVIDFPNTRPTFGSNLSSDRVMLNKINPFVSMFVKLRRDEIVATLEALHPLLREELRIQEQIA